MKVESSPAVDPTLEVAFFPPRQSGLGPFAGLFLASAPGRMVRPVLQRASGRIELIGPLEQTHLEVACLPEEVHEGTTHQELDPTNMLSLIASLTPFSDQNQSPRNMYQCQMGKQTMGTPAHCMPHRTDNKMYKIQTPQAPIVQTRRHAEYQLDEYPQGTNAVVAVISYTGFDMEDAMILNKASFERGFAHASIYKTKIINLDDEEEKAASLEDGTKPTLRFGNTRPTNFATEVSPSVAIADVSPVRKIYEELDFDGLPHVGQWLEQDDPLYCLLNTTNGESHVTKHKDVERACVQTIRLLGSDGKNKDKLRRVSVTLRIPRNPIIGDKFSSRHGQKGVMSVLWPQEDMPFSESGISPDVIINPHAFPSRMTIGMLVESMAGKSGALHGMYQDATPFQFNEKDTAINYFGEQLRAAGYSYWGSEPMYSGLSGLPLQVDIYLGLVYYQRLRHMVSDKAQVRSTGGVSPVTRQPVKGRKRGGGIRFGEMERDSLISHGTAFLLHDRLMNCSDRHIGYVCRTCGSMLSPCPGSNALVYAGQSEVVVARALSRFGKWVCTTCGPEAKCEAVSMPYVFRYLVNELAALGIKVTLGLDHV
uniref:DNA-directed RNA polymerase n=1 Tax=Pinguiococcus pyrenoidosus TaxID=172671 RepID=A0A7R9U7R0_9STRA